MKSAMQRVLALALVLASPYAAQAASPVSANVEISDITLSFVGFGYSRSISTQIGMQSDPVTWSQTMNLSVDAYTLSHSSVLQELSGSATASIATPLSLASSLTVNDANDAYGAAQTFSSLQTDAYFSSPPGQVTLTAHYKLGATQVAGASLQSDAWASFQISGGSAPVTSRTFETSGSPLEGTLTLTSPVGSQFGIEVLTRSSVQSALPSTALSFTPTVAAVPEPQTAAMSAIGLLVVAGSLLRSRSRSRGQGPR